MILFIFEGKDDKTYFESIKRLFFPEKSEAFVCTYNSNIYSLYTKLKNHDALNGKLEVDTVSVFKEILTEKGDNTLKDIREDEVSEIYLFFDYDFQNRMGLKKLNDILEEMLTFFSNETENGRLYINYPMVESLKYTKDLPDDQYNGYVATRQECVEHKFKDNAEKFACSKAKGYRFIDVSKIDKTTAISNWEQLKLQNVKKANYIISGNDAMPDSKDTVNQKKIFNAQIEQYVEPKEQVSILNSFPIFVYDYLKE